MSDGIYCICEIKSSVNTGDASDIKELIQKTIKNGKIIVWLDYKLMFCTLKNGYITTGEEISDFYSILNKHLHQMRIFNENEELFIWKKRLGTKFRYRKDHQGETCKIIDTKQVLWGSSFEYKDGDNFVKVSEARGVAFDIPIDWFDENTLFSNQNRLMLVTRNYIGYTELGQATFYDHRFVKVEIETTKSD